MGELIPKVKELLFFDIQSTGIVRGTSTNPNNAKIGGYATEVLLFGKPYDSSTKSIISERTICVRVRNFCRRAYAICNPDTPYETLAEKLSHLLTKKLKIPPDQAHISPGLGSMFYPFLEPESLGRGEKTVLSFAYPYKYAEISSIHNLIPGDSSPLQEREHFDDSWDRDASQEMDIYYYIGQDEDIVKQFMVSGGICGYGIVRFSTPLELFSGELSEYRLDLLHNDIESFSEIPSDQPWIDRLKKSCLRTRCVTNSKTRVRELSSLIIDDVVFARKLPGIRWPPDFKSTSKFRAFDTELAMLRAFLEYFRGEDPDILLGHELLETDFPLIISRSLSLGIKHSELSQSLSRISTVGSGTPRAKYVLRGRLICDLWDFALNKSNIKGLKTYQLSEIYSSTCVLADISDLSDEQRHHIPDILGLSTGEYYCRGSRGLDDLYSSLSAEVSMCTQIESKLFVLRLSQKICLFSRCRWIDALLEGKTIICESLFLSKFNENDILPPPPSRGIPKAEDSTQPRKVGVKRKRTTPAATTTTASTSATATGSAPAPQGYSGGLIIDPEVGAHSGELVLLDVLSLYPSAAVMMKLCFMNEPWERLDYARAAFDEIERDPRAFLYKLFEFLIKARAEAKSQVRSPGDDKDVEQFALKVLTNSIYGVLGRLMYRFSCVYLAAIITECGRYILGRAVGISKKHSVPVIYGHTDSILVNFQGFLEDFRTAFIQEINGYNPHITMKIDARFSQCLVLKKNSYISKDARSGNVQYKGTDIGVRNSFEVLSECSILVAEQLLLFKKNSPVSTLAGKVNGIVSRSVESMPVRPLHEFVIATKLGKGTLSSMGEGPKYNPSTAKGKKLLPHVQVANWIVSKGGRVQEGQIVEHVVCTKRSNKNLQLFCHPLEFEQMSHMYQLDYEYYAQRLRMSVRRLCESVSTDLSHLLFLSAPE